MKTKSRHEILAQLQASQEELSALLTSVAEQQDWKPAPEQWSFRFVAAHLAASEKECLQPRLKQMASGSQSHFDFYNNSETDFSRTDLRVSLLAWKETRQEISSFVQDLDEETLTYIAHHDSFGDISILDYLDIWLEHDREHLQDLTRALISFDQKRED